MGLKDSRVTTIGDIIGDILKNPEIERGLDEEKICASWGGVVGEELASMTKGISCRNGIFYVTCTSAVVRNKLSMNKEGIISRLNGVVGKKIVNKIVIR